MSITINKAEYSAQSKYAGHSHIKYYDDRPAFVQDRKQKISLPPRDPWKPTHYQYVPSPYDIIRLNAITARDIAVGTITSDKITIGTITWDKIIFGTISGDSHHSEPLCNTVVRPSFRRDPIRAARTTMNSATGQSVLIPRFRFRWVRF